MKAYKYSFRDQGFRLLSFSFTLQIEKPSIHPPDLHHFSAKIQGRVNEQKIVDFTRPYVSSIILTDKNQFRNVQTLNNEVRKKKKKTRKTTNHYNLYAKKLMENFLKKFIIYMVDNQIIPLSKKYHQNLNMFSIYNRKSSYESKIQQHIHFQPQTIFPSKSCV